MNRFTPWTKVLTALPSILWVLIVPGVTDAQPYHPNKVDLRFDRFYDYDELSEALRKLAQAYPDLLTLQSIGRSVEGREMWMVTINNPRTGPDRDKAAIYIDGNVHGNEVQASEACLYTIWYLTKSYGQVEALTSLMDERAFYILPTVNPDGRAYWFNHPNTSHSSRSGVKPTDDDRDGLFDEDGPDDLNGDGYITYMWKKDPKGRYRRSVADPRRFERVGPDEKGDYELLGSEGIDNDGDGLINEDGVGGYDMNRNWPSDWRPEHLQYGAGDYPFSYPETACVGQFILDHPNIAAVQSYHNAGGMLLRGPGAQYREDHYPRQDVAVYDELGKTGEKMIPYYNYLVIYKDLYTVHGGFVNWTAEGLGIFSFTNELWTNDQYYAGKEGDWNREEARYKFNDLLQFGQTFAPYEIHEHPFHGEILIGGWNKYASRVPPTFMLEELCHRNFAFTMYHADQMPLLEMSLVETTRLGADAWSVIVEVENQRLIPTVSALAADKKIGARDWIELKAAPSNGAASVEVLASGTIRDRYDRRMEPTEHRPARIWVDRGIPSRGRRLFRWIVRGAGPVEVTYESQKARAIRQTIELTPEAPQAEPPEREHWFSPRTTP